MALLPFNEFLSEGKVDQKTGHMGHWAVHRDLHKHVGTNPADFEKHLNSIKKKHGYEMISKDHDSDKHRERSAGELMPGSEHHHYTMHHPDGHKEHVYVSHSRGKIHRIGHTSTTDVGRHTIHTPGTTYQYVNGVKKRTEHHQANGTIIQHHD